jgi:UbiD family decarboxylase
MAAISKAFDNSKALVANDVTNYPNSRLISNLWATKERCARLFGVDEFKDIKFKLLESLHNPIALRVVERDAAPCQEIVLERDQIGRVEDILPLGMHTEDDGGRFFGNGVHFIGSPWVPGGGTQFSFYRMSFRDGQQYASVNMGRAARAIASAGDGPARGSR